MEVSGRCLPRPFDPRPKVLSTPCIGDSVGARAAGLHTLEKWDGSYLRRQSNKVSSVIHSVPSHCKNQPNLRWRQTHWSGHAEAWHLLQLMYTRVNKNPSAWNFLSPIPEVTCVTVAIIIRFVLLSPYLRIRAVSLSFIHYNQSHRVYINRRRQYICLIWN